MAIDFRPVHARLDRARDHLATLAEDVDTYVRLPPYRTTRTRPDDRGWITERAELVVEPPLRMSLALSDLTHQLRAALDNVVGCLRPSGPTGESGFPIRADEEAYAALAQKRLLGVPDWARTYIEQVQPFGEERRQTPGERSRRMIGDALLVLDELARRDRHRAMLLQAVVVQPDYAVQHVEGAPIHWRADGQSIAPEAGYPQGAFRVYFEVEVTLAEVETSRTGMPVISVGREMLRAVEYGVVEQLAILSDSDPGD